ncbi:Nucleoporin Nup37 [Pseudolycoriella hygida]|uniref:Nucleoporin Nup37 n=1 Tax=Pseudolycoriella hygida TaxID=35572 RepID=A0A9Q0NEK8_9DIPT|nr:Nucleoporin Nup37 [Pseudolycoriella hygida]
MKKVAPSHTIDLDKQIYCFELSAYEWSQNLVCIAVESKIILGLIKFPEDSENEDFEWKNLEEIHHEPRCTAIAFAPETSLAVIPKVAKFGTAGVDFKLRIFNTNLDSKPNVHVLQGHSNYINDIAWDPEGRYLSSVSDDNFCKVWTNSDDKCSEHSTFPLRSAGMSVKWHPDDSEKIMVAEKKGMIHMYNVASQQVVLTVEATKSPLMSADWSLNNRLHVSALVAGEIIFWDLRYSCRSLETKSIHEDGGLCVKYSPNNENVTASVGRPDITLKVTHFQSKIPQIEASLKLFGGLCWHYRLPYVGVATDRKLCFWKVNTK